MARLGGIAAGTMMNQARTLTPRLFDALHSEALLLADEARAYFEGPGQAVRLALTPSARVEFACEALKLTSRLTQVLTWLMEQRAAHERCREAIPTQLREIPSGARAIAALPQEARQLVLAGIDLHARIVRLRAGLKSPSAASESPARTLIRRLEASY